MLSAVKFMRVRLGKPGLVAIVSVALLSQLMAFLYQLVSSPHSVPDAWVVEVTLRGVSLCYLLANLSLWVQADGLSGRLGLFPLPSVLQSLQTWVENYPKLPSHNPLNMALTKLTIWLFSSTSLKAHARNATIAALVGLAYPHPVVFGYLYVNYFATRRVLPEMFSLQWDSLLCESGVYCTVLSSASALSGQGLAQTAMMLAFKLLTFRLYFGSGLVKLTSGDLTWRQCTALWHHFLTQPLPNSASPSLHSLDREALRVMCAAALIAETVVPLVALVPEPIGVLAAIAFGIFFSLQLGIMFSGRFGFFNLLSIFVSLPLLNSPHFSPPPPQSSSWPLQMLLSATPLAIPAAVLLLGNYCAIVALLSRCSFLPTSRDGAMALPPALRSFLSILVSTSCCGHYGLFATMTIVRDEVEVEISADADAANRPEEESAWVPVRWRCKPSHPHPLAPSGRLSWPPLHMPRVDWRLWFLSLSAARQLRTKDGEHSSVSSASLPPVDLPAWFNTLLIGILERQPEIMSLLHPEQDLPSTERSKDTDKDPPQGKERIRVRLVRYSFPSPLPPPAQPSSTASQGMEERGRSRVRLDLDDDDPRLGDADPLVCITSYPRVVLAPCSLEDLYLNKPRLGASLYGHKPKIQAEQAADVIQRALSNAGARLRKK